VEVKTYNFYFKPMHSFINMKLSTQEHFCFKSLTCHFNFNNKGWTRREIHKHEINHNLF